VLSKGYGKYARLHGIIESYAEVPRRMLPPEALAIYPNARKFAAIGIRLNP